MRFTWLAVSPARLRRPSSMPATARKSRRGRGTPGNSSGSNPVMTPFERAFMAQLVADWILQNDWMARNKESLRHPAAWAHGGIQAVCLGWALGWQAGLVLGLIHMLIDTRAPVAWWMRVFKKCSRAPEVGAIAIWLDQTLHLVCIAAWVALVRS